MFGFPRRGTNLSCLFPPALFSSGMPPFLPHPRLGNVVMEITRPRNALEQLPPLPKTFFLVFFLVVESKQLVRLMNVYSIVNDKFFEPSFLTLSNTSLSSFNVKREFVRISKRILKRNNVEFSSYPFLKFVSTAFLHLHSQTHQNRNTGLNFHRLMADRNVLSRREGGKKNSFELTISLSSEVFETVQRTSIVDFLVPPILSIPNPFSSFPPLFSSSLLSLFPLFFYPKRVSLGRKEFRPSQIFRIVERPNDFNV